MTDALPSLPTSYLNMLSLLYEAGGSGTLDKHGRVVIASSRRAPRHAIPGDPIGWLRLMARGYVAGELDKVILTEAGREKGAEIVAGRTKVAQPF